MNKTEVLLHSGLSESGLDRPGIRADFWHGFLGKEPVRCMPATRPRQVSSLFWENNEDLSLRLCNTSERQLLCFVERLPSAGFVSYQPLLVSHSVLFSLNVLRTEGFYQRKAGVCVLPLHWLTWNLPMVSPALRAGFPLYCFLRLPQPLFKGFKRCNWKGGHC